MKNFTFYIIILFILLSLTFAQSIKWTRVYHDDYGRPLYTGGTSYSAPTFADIDGDGDYDYFQGCENGTIWFFENTGTPDSAVWHFVTDKYNDIEFSYLEYSNVTFADIDADGDLDMFVGGNNYYDKGIHYYENMGDSISPVWLFVTDKYMNIDTYTCYGCYSHTQFIDIDNDNDFDLFFVNRNAEVEYYKNIGSDTSANFIFKTDNLLNFNGGNTISLLEIKDIDKDNDCDIFVLSMFWRNTGTPDSASWQLENNNYYDLEYSLGLELNDIDNDDDYDMFVGMHDGKVYYYENITTANEPVWQFINNNLFTIDVGFQSCPSLCDINGDSLPELFINNCYYRNEGTKFSPLWILDTTRFLDVNYSGMSSFAFVDIDNDGDNDIYVSQYKPQVIRHENTGDSFNPQYDSNGIVEIEFDWEGCVNFHPVFVDIDADGDYDLYISCNNSLAGCEPILINYENIGTKEEPEWTNVFTSNDYPYGTVEFMDEDNDGDYDMFIGSWGDDFFGKINFYRNTGDKCNPEFEFITPNYGNITIDEYDFSKDYINYNIYFYDVDSDNDKDLIIGEKTGGISYFRNDSIQSSIKNNFKNIPDGFKLYQNYPNPFNNQTVIQFEIRKKSKVNMFIYNLVGQKIETLVNNQEYGPGNHKIVWRSNMSSGIYFIYLSNGIENQIIKTILIK